VEYSIVKSGNGGISDILATLEVLTLFTIIIIYTYIYISMHWMTQFPDADIERSSSANASSSHGRANE